MQHVPATLLEHLAHFTECQLATVEGLRLLKRPSKTELSRHESIAIMMLTACYRYGLTRLAARDQDYGRVADALALLAEHRARSFKPEDEAK
jgi:predicted transcriptional regulator